MTSRESKTISKNQRYNCQVCRVVISFLDYPVNTQYADCKSPRVVNLRPDLEKLKSDVLHLLVSHEKHLQHYKIAWETHSRNHRPHLDILLAYGVRVKKHSASYDYLLQICPQVLSDFPVGRQVPQTRLVVYSLAKLCSAIIDYGDKEDPAPVSNFSQQCSARYLTLHKLKSDAYAFLSQVMSKDPYNFDLAEYAVEYDLHARISNWTAIKSKLLDIRAAMIAKLELTKPGFHRITPQLIAHCLSPAEHSHYRLYADSVYDPILQHLNQICTYGSRRPHKTSNLLITGPKNTGKTALTETLATTVGRYNVKYENKYLNRYSNHKYGFIVWNEVKFTDFSHTWILEFLEGIEVAIPMRYNSCLKRDNPLIIMTTNLSLHDHMVLRYGDSTAMYTHAMANLSARLTNIVLPQGANIFFMQKLIVPADQPLPVQSVSQAAPTDSQCQPVSPLTYLKSLFS